MRKINAYKRALALCMLLLNDGYWRVGLAIDICALTSEDCQNICRYWEFISVSSYHKDAKGDPFQCRGQRSIEY
ncbi:hypothetical protein ACJW30_11G169400 [Castanea mollissima]